MLHTVLMILKIIGIIVLFILGILLVCLGCILWVPVQYKLKADAIGDIDMLKGHGKYSWLFHIVSGRFAFVDGYFVNEVKFLGVKLKRKEKNKESKEDDKEIEKKNAEKKEERRKAARKAKWRKLTFFEKMEYTFFYICDKIRILIDAKDRLDDFINEDIHRAAWKKLKKELGCFWKSIKPKQLEGSLLLGAEDPAVTGNLLARMSILYPFFPETFEIIPDFTRRVFEGKIFAKGRIRIYHILKFIISINLDKNVKTTFEDIEKLKG